MVILNEYKQAGTLQLFENANHLVADLMQAVADGKRIFVATTKRQAKAIAAAIDQRLGAERKCLLITQDTKRREAAKAFISDPA